MIAIDTNILVRYLTKDDARQTVEATTFLAENDCVILDTVLLETVWVLGSKNGYGWQRHEVTERLRHVLGLPMIFAQNPENLRNALAWYEVGMDFADALHLSGSHAQSAFATFDRNLKAHATSLKASPPIVLLDPDTG